jgi:citronellol/citronellal dehydrogenase
MQPSDIFRGGLLDGKVAVVTGGGTGIGAAITRELGRMGAQMVICSRKASTIEPAAAGLSEQLDSEVLGLTCDIRDRAQVAAFYEQVMAQRGRIDILVNNGGGQFFAPAQTITDNGWDAVVGTNLTGTWNMIKGAGEAHMFEHGGTILNVTMLTKRTFPGMAHSHAARAGVEALTRTLAVEWASKQIRVNCIAPGLIASSGLRRYPAGLNVMTEMARYIPMKRPGRVQDVAWMAAFLASPAGAYITGQTFTVDGGKELWGDWWPIADPEEPHGVTIPVEPWESE